MFKKIILTTIVVYIVGHLLAVAATKNCKGWKCEEVDCPSGYAVLVPGVGYLPCDKFEAYVDHNDTSVILK